MTDFDSAMMKLNRRVANMEAMVIELQATRKRNGIDQVLDEEYPDQAVQSVDDGRIEFRQACADLSEWRKNVNDEFENLRSTVVKMKETVDGLVDDLTRPETPKDADGYPVDDGRAKTPQRHVSEHPNEEG